MKTQLDLLSPTAKPALTVLSYGAGQDSACILEKLIREPACRQRYAPGQLIVVCADTGDEFDFTYDEIRFTQARCQRLGIPFFHLTPDMGFHHGKWQSLRVFYRDTQTCGSKVFRKTCTDNLKIKPIYRFLEHYLSQHYGTCHHRKQGFYDYAQQFGKLTMLIGIARDEEKRLKAASNSKWMNETIDKVYPLIEWGMNSKIAKRICTSMTVMSNRRTAWRALLCHSKNSNFYVDFIIRNWRSGRSLNIENYNALPIGKPIMVCGEKGRLGQKVCEAAQQFAHWSDDTVRAYRFSHGHCVSQSY